MTPSTYRMLKSQVREKNRLLALQCLLLRNESIEVYIHLMTFTWTALGSKGQVKAYAHQSVHAFVSILVLEKVLGWHCMDLPVGLCTMQVKNCKHHRLLDRELQASLTLSRSSSVLHSVLTSCAGRGGACRAATAVFL